VHTDEPWTQRVQIAAGLLSSGNAAFSRLDVSNAAEPLAPVPQAC
jgi:hypothetical protein